MEKKAKYKRTPKRPEAEEKGIGKTTPEKANTKVEVKRPEWKEQGI